MSTNTPIRLIGHWETMMSEQRETFVNRGKDKIFDPQMQESIRQMIEEVRTEGDAAVIRALQKFDGVDLNGRGLRVADEEYDAARAAISEDMLEAIRTAISQLRKFNEEQLKHSEWSFESIPGLIVGERSTAIASAGLFVPSGKASYPSVLVQLAVPAVVAGVPKIAVVVPPIPGTNGDVDPAVLVVAQELGLQGHVYRVNGPAGIAALAFGTETIPKVLKVVGPGSPAVTCAQVEVQRFGTVSNMLLGPSESLILADDSADPRLLAADLLNEAEHGPDSTSILVTTSSDLLERTQGHVAEQLAQLPEQRRAYASNSIGVNGGAILAETMQAATEACDAFAAEHMQVVVKDEEAVLKMLHHAAEILLGQMTTISAANFVLGCPASLPTSGFAKVSSGITAESFRKRTAVAKSNRQALEALSSTVLLFTEHEGFPAHGAAVSARLEN